MQEMTEFEIEQISGGRISSFWKGAALLLYQLM